MKKFSTKHLLLTAFFAALTALGAFLRIPMGNSALSLQLLFSLVAGLLLGPFYGAASQGLYVLLGLAGLPVFAGGGGLTYVAMPTFGFILGLIPAALFAGLFAKNRPFFGYLLGLLALYCVGLPYFYFALDASLSPWQCFVSACLIFLPADAVKIFCAELLRRRLRKALPNL